MSPNGFTKRLSGKESEMKQSVADKAKELVHGNREATYGGPTTNMYLIAKLWSAYLGTELTANDVCNLMVLLKTARLKNTPMHEDSLVDVIGYTLLQERIRDES